MAVRTAERRELDRVAEMWIAITEHHRGLDPFFRMREDARDELMRLLEALHRDPEAAIFVFAGDDSERPPEANGAREGGDRAPGERDDLLGLCIVRIDRAPPIMEELERAEITDLGVREACRRRGIGRALVEAALAWVQAAEVERIEIQVAHGNREGQAFWRALGFDPLMDVLHRRLD